MGYLTVEGSTRKSLVKPIEKKIYSKTSPTHYKNIETISNKNSPDIKKSFIANKCLQQFVSSQNKWSAQLKCRRFQIPNVKQALNKDYNGKKVICEQVNSNKDKKTNRRRRNKLFLPYSCQFDSIPNGQRQQKEETFQKNGQISKFCLSFSKKMILHLIDLMQMKLLRYNGLNKYRLKQQIYRNQKQYNNYQRNSTMQKKSLDANIGVDDYNKKIFNKSIELITNCRKIPINQVSNLHRNQTIKKKYIAIEDKLHSILKILRNFTEAEKPTFNNPIDLATQILEQTKLKVDIQFRKAQEQKNTVKVVKTQLNIKKQRPQQQFPDIKPYENFDIHCHQNYLQDGIIPSLNICDKIQETSDFKTEYVYVDTVQKLREAINQMKQQSQVAVDVEHSPKSYQGFTCLIQMSTRSRDYIIDVFPIWSSVPLLQEIIGNPNIIKIMHGAQMDTKWLQRDFNIHIINLFDTHKASRVLGMERFSYAFLLNKYCLVSTDKKYQLQDWRQRPLSPQMLRYARIDTHYLLKIFDHIRIDLQNKSKQTNQSQRQVLKDIHKSSHEVTLVNAELFTYKSKQQYVNLSYEFQDKKQQFKAIDLIYSQINLAAVREDQSFDDLISKKDIVEVISFIKDLIFNKKSKVSKQARIEKIVTILQRSNNPLLNETINSIKRQLSYIFCQKQIHKDTQILSNSLSALQIRQAPKNEEQIEQIQEEKAPQFSREKIISVRFNELKQKSFENRVQINKKIIFTPICSFLTKKYGIEEQKQEEQVGMQEQSQQEQEQQNENKIEEQDNEMKQGMIEFKRLNPNVIYTVEQPDPEMKAVQQSKKPKKMRKQTEYENRLKNKKGNIFDLLADN